VIERQVFERRVIERRVIELVEITPHGGLDRLDQPVDRLARP